MLIFKELGFLQYKESARGENRTEHDRDQEAARQSSTTDETLGHGAYPGRKCHSGLIFRRELWRLHLRFFITRGAIPVE